ncbi:nucampholin [Achlya hypogyna]|uniref:Nucampholin n=1 Tax=Achlya hypogyna TaxID=1202772 RepID=A0A1V9YZH8_ACHHY|nr:nucampholin [Achlya hypogyna]
MNKDDMDKSSQEYQRMTWDALRKSINGLINKVNVSNIANILPELFQENLVRGRGLLVRSIMKAQLASPGFTHIYAALVAVINTKLPENGELLLKRVVHRFRRALKRGDKVVAIALVRFIAHLVNQQVAHELLALEVLAFLLTSPTDDSVEVAVNFTKECGQMLAELCPEGLRANFEVFRSILLEGDIDKRVQYTIEGLFAIRKGKFADYPAVHEQLDLVEANDQITHQMGLDDEVDIEDKLDIFRFDPEFEKNERMWKEIKKELLGEDSEAEDGDDESGDSGDSDDSDDDEAPAEATTTMQIHDFSEQDLVNLRRTIYLTIMSSVSHEECGHKLLRLNIRPGQEKEICSMLIECCSQERTYQRYYGLLGQRFCLIKREYQCAFDDAFAQQYATIHRLETNKLRNVAKFFAHLLFSDALPWTVFEYIRLSEEETTSSSRIFIKILCQELAQHLGLGKLKERFMDEYMTLTFAGLFPKENPRSMRFAINFFTSIGLGGLTVELREQLKNAPKALMNAPAPSSSSDDSSSDSSSSSSSSSGSGSESDSSDSSSDSSDSD